MSLFKRKQSPRTRRKWIVRGVVGGLVGAVALAAWWSETARQDPASLPGVVNRDIWPWGRWVLLLAVLAGVAFAARRWLSARTATTNIESAEPASGGRLAGWWEALWVTGWPSLSRRARVLRPALTADMPWWKLWRVPSRELGLLLGRIKFAWWQPSVRAFVRVQEHTLWLAPTQVGKTSALGNLVIDHPGAVLVTSTNPNIIGHTGELRRRRGPVKVFNPEGVGGVPSDFRWSPVVGCEDPKVAIERAGHLLSGSPSLGDVGSREFWESQAVGALARLMHAAGLGGLTLMQVMAWATDLDGSARTVLQLLAKSPAGHAWQDRHRDFVNLNHNTRSSVTTTIMPALDWLQDPDVAVLAMPGEGEQFDVETWLKESGTVYLLAEDREHGSIAPLFTAFTSYVYTTAKRIASKSPGGRLDPAARFILDEAANVCPTPLHRWASDSAGRGIGLDIGLQSYEQLPWKWGSYGGKIIWDNLTVKLIFGGFDDPERLATFSAITGSRAGRHGLPTAVVPVDLIRRLPDWNTLLLRRGMRPAFLRMRPVFRRRDVKAAKRAAAVTVPEQAEAPAAQLNAATAEGNTHHE